MRSAQAANRTSHVGFVTTARLTKKLIRPSFSKTFINHKQANKHFLLRKYDIFSAAAHFQFHVFKWPSSNTTVLQIVASTVQKA